MARVRRPIYQLFVEKAIELDPRYCGVRDAVALDGRRQGARQVPRADALRQAPAEHRGLSRSSTRCFPGVKIRGGISYFLWDRDYDGPCEVQTIWDGQPTGPAVARHLDAYDILVRRNEAVPILEKVRAQEGDRPLDARVSQQKPFGLRTFFQGKPVRRASSSR